ncbi:MAG: hypothetical protein WC711_00350 [Candidatus Staskawiczbacteria bacterium]
MSIPIGVTEKNALFSVSDKTDLAEHARILSELGYTIYASGGTAKVIKTAGTPVIDVADLVGGGEILHGRVKTLSRQLHAALLADALKPEDLAELLKDSIPFIDFVRVDFYPLKKMIEEVTLSTPNREEAIKKVIEETDIGGPTLARSASKGFRAVVCRVQDMETVLDELKETGAISSATRQWLRANAEFEVAKYVGMSAEFHGNGRFKVITGERVGETFKGENGPQSPAALYSTGSDDPLSLDKFELIAGSSLGYNNWCDVHRLLETMTRMAAAYELNYGKVPYIAVGCKHGNPCGAALVGDSPYLILRQMVFGDRRAIFGGFVMTNFKITEEQAEVMVQAMLQGKPLFDGVVAPGFTNQAIDKLKRSKGQCRMIVNPALAHAATLLDVSPRFRYVRGGFLAQPNYDFLLNFNDPELKVYGSFRPSIMKADLLLASAIGSTSNSNTITIVRNGMLIGNGVGQQDRVGSAELAVKRAIDAGHGSFTWWGKLLRRLGSNYTRNSLEGAVAYSDSFFPFPDGVQVLIDAGIKVIFSTSGSRNDKAVQDLCVDQGVVLVQLPDSKARGFFGH